MADPQQMVFSKTSELNNAAALVGAELLRIVQGGADVKATVSVLLAAALTLPKLTGMVTTDSNAVVAADTLIQAIGKIQAQLNKAVNEDEVGSAPNQVPVNQLLGRTAFGDVVGATQVYRHKHASVRGDVWFEYVSNTQLKLNFHGLDDVTRSQTLTLA